eukprot:412726-Rhodomonas_salina.1
MAQRMLAGHGDGACLGSSTRSGQPSDGGRRWRGRAELARAARGRRKEREVGGRGVPVLRSASARVGEGSRAQQCGEEECEKRHDSEHSVLATFHQQTARTEVVNGNHDDLELWLHHADLYRHAVFAPVRGSGEGDVQAGQLSS